MNSRFVLVKWNPVRVLVVIAVLAFSGPGFVYQMRNPTVAIVTYLSPTMRAVLAVLGALAVVGMLFIVLPPVLMRFAVITVHDGTRVRAYRWPIQVWFPSRRRDAVREIDLRRAEFTTSPLPHNGLLFVIRTPETEIVTEGPGSDIVPNWEERWERLQESLRAGDSTESGSDG